MRHVLAALFCASAFAANSVEPAPRPPITLVLQFEGERSEESVQAMKAEFESLMRESGLTFEYRLRSELDHSTPIAHLILVRFKGRCRMDSLPVLFDERGPYAATHVSDGEILPFGQVACDRVRVSVRSSMTGDHLKRGDYYFGRALGRVLAHEVYHMLARTRAHGTKGVAKTALSGEELLADDLRFDHQDVGKIREAGF